MGPARFIARSQRRGRRASTLVLAILVAVAGASILALSTAYRRADTVIARWTAGAIPYDRSIVAQLPPAQLSAMPGVVRADREAYIPLRAAGNDDHDAGCALDGHAMEMSAVDSTYLLLGGAIPNGTDPFAVLATEEAAKTYHLRPGDMFRVQFYAPDQFESAPQGDSPRGPIETVRIAGVVRAPADITSDRWVGCSSAASKTHLVFPISLYDHIGDQILRFGLGWFYNIQLGPGTDLAAFEQLVQAAVGEGVDDIYPAFVALPPVFPPRRDELAAPVNTQADILVALLAVIVATSTLAVAVAVRTSQRQFERDRATLSALGTTRGIAIVTACWRAWPAIGSGLAGAVPLAWSASNRLPIGLATKVEPTPGRTLNVALTATVMSAWGLVVTACIVAAAVVDERRTPKVTPRRRMFPAVPRRLELALTLTRASRGHRAVRAGVAAAVVAAAALTGTGLFVSGIDRLVDQPAMHGFWGGVMVGNSNFPLTDDTRAAISALPGVRTASELTYIPQMEVGGRTIDLVVLEPSDVARERIATSGRFPIASREIMLGSGAATAMHKRIGDIVTISGQNEPADFTVVGIGPAPVLGDVPFGGAAVISSSALTDDWPGPPPQMMVVELDQGRRGIDAAVAQLSSQVPDIVVDIVPGKIDNLHDLRGLLLAAALVSAFVAALLIVNANVVATRRQARDAAILGACGATPTDLVAIAGWQGLAMGLTVGVAGALLGAVAGARVWQATAEALGVPARVHVPGWVALAMVVPVAFHVVLSTVAWWWVRSSLGARALRVE